ncbi:hypothetical protein FRC01_013914, partial [Tulasnella sp. 417]
IAKNHPAPPAASADSLLQTDEHTKCSPSPSTPTTTKHSASTLSTVFSRGEREVSSLQPSRVVIPSLPAVPDDGERNGRASPAPSANNALQPTGVKLHGIVTGDRSPSRARSNVATGSVSDRSSRKIESEGADFIDPAGWRGRSLDEIAAALRRRGAATVPQSIPQAIPTPTLSSSDGNSSSIAGASALNQPTTPRSMEVQQDRPWETRAPDPSRMVISPLLAQPDDSKPTIVRNGPSSPAASVDNPLQIPVAPQVHGILTRECSRNRARCDFATGSVPDKSSRKIPTEAVDGFDPAGWRGRSLEEIAEALRGRGGATVPQSIPQATPAPTLYSSDGNTSSISGSPALNHSTSIGLQQDRPWEAGTPNYSPYTTFGPRSDTPAEEAKTVVPKLLDSGEEPTVESFRDDVPQQ